MKRVHKEALPQAVEPQQQTGPAPEDLTAIGAFSRGELRPEEVYTFAVRLCDNQTDREDEYFDRAALEVLAELYIGKTGIFDHSWSAKEQTARIYATELVEEPGIVTEAGESGCYLKGWAYMLRTQENEGLIAEIEGGIKKEVSVGCAVAHERCSICGNDIRDRSVCSHVKGGVYDGKRCIVCLTEPTDAYEWSFVAVPAQRNAGVVKTYQTCQTGQTCQTCQGQGTLREVLRGLSPEGSWQEELHALEQQAETGRRYLDGLRQETVRLGLLAEEGLTGSTLRSIADKLDEDELRALHTCYHKRLTAQRALPLQLHYGGPEQRGEETFQAPDTLETFSTRESPCRTEFASPGVFAGEDEAFAV